MSSLRILHVTSELSPYFTENHISHIVYNLAKQMYDKGNDVRIFMPKFGTINERRFQLHEVQRLSGMNIIINDLDQPLIIKVASLPGERMQVYFIDNDEYFKRKSLYGNEEMEWFEDNNERAIFFVKGVLETIKKLNWVPDIIHVHGWMSSFLPIYIKNYYKDDSFFSESHTLLSVYNHIDNKEFREDLYDILAFDNISLPYQENKDINTILKNAMQCADYNIKAEEVLKPKLEELFNELEDDEYKQFRSEEDMAEVYSQIKELVESN